MIVVTTDFVPGYEIVQTLGIVTGSIVNSKHVGKDIAAAFKLNTFPYQLGARVFEKNSVDLPYTFGIVVVCALFIWLGYIVFERKEV